MRAIDYSNFEMTLIAPDGEATKVDLPTRLKQFGLLATTDRHLIVQLAAEAQIAGRPLPAETLLAYDVTATAGDRHRVQVVYSPHVGEYLSTVSSGVNPPIRGLARCPGDALDIDESGRVERYLSIDAGPPASPGGLGRRIFRRRGHDRDVSAQQLVPGCLGE
jgi:hypothetical protein